MDTGITKRFNEHEEWDQYLIVLAFSKVVSAIKDQDVLKRIFTLGNPIVTILIDDNGHNQVTIEREDVEPFRVVLREYISEAL